MHATPPRRWFSFSLRTMFALITLACLAAGWFAYQLTWISQRHEFLNKWGIGPDKCIRVVFDDEVSATALSHDVSAPSFLWLFGENGKREMVVFTNILADDERTRLKSLFPETKLVNVQLRNR